MKDKTDQFTFLANQGGVFAIKILFISFLPKLKKQMLNRGGGAEYFVPPRPVNLHFLKIEYFGIFLRRCKMFDFHHLPMNAIPIYR